MAVTLVDGWRERIDGFVTDWLSEERVPGAAVAVVDGDDVAHTAGYGARDLAADAPATPATLYGVASVTKSVTALAVLQQVERTDLALGDPVTDHLDFYDDLADPPTVHELLSHSSGLPSDGASVVLIARLTGEDPVEVPLSSPADLRRHVAGATRDRTEGEFFYYNTGYTVLGRLVEALDGRPFPEYVGDEILAPLGMTRSVVAPDDLDAVEDAMTPYRTDDGDRVEADFPVKGVGAAGGLVASVEELASYLAFQLDPDPDVVAPDLLAEAHAAHATRQTYLDGDEQGYGYGWMRRSLLGDTLVEHGGSLGVSTAYVGYLEDAEIGVALSCNDSPEAHPQFVGPALLATAVGEEPAAATRFYALRARAARVAGHYESHRGVQTAEVTPTADGTIEVELATALGDQSFEAFPESTAVDDRTYYTVEAGGARVPLRFVDADDGLDLLYRRWRLRGESRNP
ncbi:MAG: serine hydrolase [Halolamina sp.]